MTAFVLKWILTLHSKEVMVTYYADCRAPELVLDLVLYPILLGFFFLVASMTTR